MAIPSPKPTPAPQPSAPAAGTLTPDAVIAERYRVVSLLGEGGMGAVYRVEHVHMRKAFALKVLHGAASKSPEIVARFEREAVAAASISHPNVVGATDFGKLPDGSFFLVLELVDGRSLRSELEAGALDPIRATKIMRGVVSAVAAAHAKGIVHRDLKPENVMLVQRDGDDDFVKVLDFGIAKIDDATTGRESGVQALTRVGTIMGTPDYMSPEQALGQPVDARSDLYTIGIIFFELLTGACPFRGSGVTVLRQHIMDAPPAVPPEVLARLGPRVSEVIGKLLAKEPAARFQTAAELLYALDETAPRAPTVVVEAVATPSADRTTEPEASGPRPLSGRIVSRLTAFSPTSLKPYVTGRRLAMVGCGLAAVIVFAVVTLFISTSTRVEPTPIVGAASSLASASSSQAPAPSATTQPPRLPDPAETASDDSALSPAPQPSADTNASRGGAPSSGSSPPPSSRPSRTRKTGPGGIYIPPPRDWFK